MTKREKIFLAVTGAVAVIGLATLYWPGSGPGNGGGPAVGTGKKIEDVRTQAAAVLKSIKDMTANGRDSVVLKDLETPWRSEVFYDKPVGQTQAKPQAQALPKYTGYVELGGGRLAVIDGFEYQAGDELEGGNYKVIEIAPDHVTLENLSTGKSVKVDYQDQAAAAP